MDEHLAVLLLDDRLRRLAVESHARSLLAFRAWSRSSPAACADPAFCASNAVRRQAARIWLPGELRVIVLYHPANIRWRARWPRPTPRPSSGTRPDAG